MRYDVSGPASGTSPPGVSGSRTRKGRSARSRTLFGLAGSAVLGVAALAGPVKAEAP